MSQRIDFRSSPTAADRRPTIAAPSAAVGNAGSKGSSWNRRWVTPGDVYGNHSDDIPGLAIQPLGRQLVCHDTAEPGRVPGVSARAGVDPHRRALGFSPYLREAFRELSTVERFAQRRKSGVAWRAVHSHDQEALGCTAWWLIEGIPAHGLAGAVATEAC
jgi:hypothetical protein